VTEAEEVGTRANTTEGHREIIEQLPDYAIGALDDAELDRVAGHLEGCAACRNELRRVVEMVAILSEQPFPNRSTRERLLARARGQAPSPNEAFAVPAPPTLLPLQPIPAKIEDSPESIRPWWKTRLPIALAAAAAILLFVFGMSMLRTDPESAGRDTIAGIVADAPFYVLTDSELSPPASGVLYARPDESRAVLRATGLPPLPVDRHYHVWLFTDEGDRASGGQFSVDAAGRAQVLLETPRPLATYAAIAVSAEPVAGSETPTSPLALGGWLE
jgi:hypothetical protein